MFCLALQFSILNIIFVHKNGLTLLLNGYKAVDKWTNLIIKIVIKIKKNFLIIQMLETARFF